jgi:hypothetical protein
LRALTDSADNVAVRLVRLAVFACAVVVLSALAPGRAAGTTAGGMGGMAGTGAAGMTGCNASDPSCEPVQEDAGVP